MMKLLIVSDIHGRHEAMTNAFDKFFLEDYDQIIFLGDFMDSFDRTNDDMSRCFDLLVTMQNYTEPGRIIALLGNHDVQYMYGPEYRCSGFRPEYEPTAKIYFHFNRELFQVAHGVGNYLFTHAGVQKKWFTKHWDTIQKIGEMINVDPTEVTNLHLILNAIANSSYVGILNEVGVVRGGLSGDYGGPTWCDKTEMMSYGPLPGLHQIVGHTPVPYIQEYRKFEGDKQYNNTSVTFMDVLGKKEEFKTLII